MKIAGIIILVIGNLIFLWSGAACLHYMILSKEKLIAQYEKTGRVPAIHMDPPDYKTVGPQLRVARTACGIVAGMGVGIALAGYGLYRRGKKYSPSN